MRRIHIIGGKNHGKTTLVEELVREMSQRGLRIGTIKHTHHHHELDVPGKDSHRHRAAGAAVVGILTRAMNAVFWTPHSHTTGSAPVGEERYEQFTSAFTNCDLVLVEGDTQTTAPKLEVWRATLGTPPLCRQLKHVAAVITDDPLNDAVYTLPRSDIPQLVNEILSRW